MGSTRTIEGYVRDIVQVLEEANYERLEETYDTLVRMKYSSKSKHELNYWRVLQCMGEVAIEKLVHAVVKIEKQSCKCHVHANLLIVMKLFIDGLFNVSVIKRVLQFKVTLSPLLFRSVRQSDEPQLVNLGMVAMYRCILVGKKEMAEYYMKYGLMKDVYQHIKCKHDTENYGLTAVSEVQDCMKLLLAVSVYGTDSIRRQIKRHSVLRILGEYTTKLKTDKGGVQSLVTKVTELRQIVSDEKAAQAAINNWKTKLKLREDVDEEEEFIFCSSPNCRKRAGDSEKFRYCGACRLSRYCSELCQREHWKKGHKEACLRQGGTTRASDV